MQIESPKNNRSHTHRRPLRINTPKLQTVPRTVIISGGHYHLNRIAPPFTVFRYLRTIVSGVVYKINICYGGRDAHNIGARISHITIRMETRDVWPAVLAARVVEA